MQENMTDEYEMLMNAVGNSDENNQFAQTRILANLSGQPGAVAKTQGDRLR